MVGRGRPGNHQAKIARLGGVVQTQEVSLLPDRGKSKGRPRRERLFLHSQPGLKQSREALPRPRRWARRPRHRDAETQRRGLPLPVWRGGGARGAFWFVYKEAPPALGGYEPALESQCPGGCCQRVRWFSPPRRRSHPLRCSQRQVKGRGSAASPAFAPGASPQS